MAESVANLKQMQRDLEGLLRDLEVGEAEMRQGPIAEARGKELEAKAQEAQELQDHIDRYNRIAGVASEGRKLQTRTMPVTDEKKKVRIIKTTPGHLFVMSEAYRQYTAQGKQGQSAWVDVKDLRNGIVKLYGEDAEKFEAKAFETKQYSDALLSDIYDAIWPQDDMEIVRFEEPEILTIRDVMNVVPATSDSIRFVRHTATTRGAETQIRRNEYDEPTASHKPWLTVEAETATVLVHTIAVLSKVTEQDIEDAPRLIALINSECRLDVRVEEERVLLYGTGNNELAGLYAQGVEGTYEFARAAAGDSLIDTIRKVRTDLRKRRIIPNAVLIDPLDWEDVELSKGTDDHFVWGLVTDLRGPRIWSLRVIESDAMTNPDTGERRLLMGDFMRGATLYDRHDVRLNVGYVDDDFARNLRTLRAEERLALAVKRPWAFEYVVTNEEES